ncbi:MAG: hypothetical protein AAF662_05245 [Pseudomonadota bacterium]
MSEQNHILKIGTVLATIAGELLTILSYIGKGGQGEVYLCEMRGRQQAFKLFFPGAATPTQLAQLEVNIQDGSPSSALVFPKAWVPGKSGNPIGYVMEYVGSDYVTLADRVNAKCDLTFLPLATACISLTHAMRLLHASGKVYGDCNLTNIMIQTRPLTGAVKIIDPDNIIPPSVVSGLVYTPNMAAPEILREKVLPNLETDLFSLAKAIFLMILGADPYVGKQFDTAGTLTLDKQFELYGRTARFVFDPVNRENRPDSKGKAALIRNWKGLPGWMKKVFIEAFCEGHSQPHKRIRESQWLDHLIRLRDSISICKNCSAQVFLDNGQPARCWNCTESVNARRILKTERSEIVVNSGTKVFPHHVDKHSRHEVKKPVAEVVRHPRDKRVLCLKNLTEKRWKVKQTDGALKEVEKGGAASLARGTQIIIGDEVAEIK